MKRAMFSDFAYAIVVGSAISVIDSFAISWKLAGFVVLIAIALEDYYTYQLLVVPHDPEGKKYTLKSLYFEFAILICWFASLTSWSQSNLLASAWWLTAFFFIKGIAGFSFHMLKRVLTKEGYREAVFLIPALVTGTLWTLHESYFSSDLKTLVLFLIMWSTASGLYWFRRP